MKYDTLLGKKVLITQARGVCRSTQRQRGTLIGLGLRGINSTAEYSCSKEILGMIKKVEHLVTISVK